MCNIVNKLAFLGQNKKKIQIYIYDYNNLKVIN